RLATKMVASVLVVFDQVAFVATSNIPAYLHGNATLPAAPAYFDVDSILRLRPGLAHTIYVELAEISYGVVLIFGFMKIFVPLPRSSVSAGFVASLDPITGDESFHEVTPIGPRSVPPFITRDSAALHFREMNATLTREAISRGATRP